MKSYNKYIESINEGWFNKKPKKDSQPIKESEPNKFEIQSEYQAPEIENEKIQQVIDEYNDAKKTCVKYLTMFKSVIYNNPELEAYFFKSAQSLGKATILLYRIATVKNKYNVTNIDIEKEFNFLANHLTKREIGAKFENKSLIGIFTKIVFFLNEIYQLLYDDYDYEDPQFRSQVNNKIISFTWKKKSELARKGTENIDPFQEENWEH